MTIEEAKDLVQARTPDIIAIANLVQRAKGNERNMAQFAEACNLTPSMLSRIVNNKITKPLSLEIIIAIYENRADRNDEALLDALTRANGMVPKDFLERIKSKDDIFYRRNRDDESRVMMKNTIINEVLDRGVPVRRVNLDKFTGVPDEKSMLYPRMRSDFALQLDENQNITPINFWAFYLFPTLLNPSAEQIFLRDARFVIRRCIERISNILLVDAWDESFFQGTKISFVFIDENVFSTFIETLSIARLHNEMTAILINPDTHSVVKEIWIPGKYEQLTNISIFDMPKPEFATSIDDSDDYIYKKDTEDDE